MGFYSQYTDVDANKAKTQLPVPHPVGQTPPQTNTALLIVPVLGKPIELKSLHNDKRMTHKGIPKKGASSIGPYVTL